MKMLPQEARQLAGYINQPIVELIEAVCMRTRSDVLEAMAVADDEKLIRRFQGRAQALKEVAGVFKEAYDISEAEARRPK